jgi:hypothetical protein
MNLLNTLLWRILLSNIERSWKKHRGVLMPAQPLQGIDRRQVRISFFATSQRAVLG